MAYKVLKKEFVKRRPKWLVRFLMLLPSQIYAAKASVSEARQSLLYIRRIIDETQLMAVKCRCHLHVDDDNIIISSAKFNPFIHFYIDTNYQNEYEKETSL